MSYYGYGHGSSYVGNVTMKIRVPSSMKLDSPSIDGAVQELAITIPGSEFYQLRPTDNIENQTAAMSNPMYYLPMRPATGRLVFGRAFLRSMYLVVDYDKGEFYLGSPPWREHDAQDLVPIVSSSNEPGESEAGAIAGGVLGGIAAVLILASAFYWLRKQRSSGGDSATAYSRYPKYEQQQIASSQGEVPPPWPGHPGAGGIHQPQQPAGRELEA